MSAAPRTLVAAANARVNATPYVRALADRLGVHLSNVEGTGVGGRITDRDVRAHASPLAAAPAARTSSDLPAFTASGIDPKALLQVPPSVRSAVAAAATGAEAYALVQRYKDMPDDEAAQLLAIDPSVSCEHGGWQGAWPGPPP